MRSFHYLAIFTIVKWDLVFSTLVDQDTNSDEEFEDIFYHQSSKELLCRNYVTNLAVNFVIEKFVPHFMQLYVVVRTKLRYFTFY